MRTIPPDWRASYNTHILTGRISTGPCNLPLASLVHVWHRYLQILQGSGQPDVYPFKVQIKIPLGRIQEKHRNPGSQLARPVALEFSKCTPRRTTTSHAECCYSPKHVFHICQTTDLQTDWLLTSPGNLELSGDSVAKILETETLGSVISIDFPGKHHSTLCNFSYLSSKFESTMGQNTTNTKERLQKMKTHTPAPHSPGKNWSLST